MIDGIVVPSSVTLNLLDTLPLFKTSNLDLAGSKLNLTHLIPFQSLKYPSAA